MTIQPFKNELNSQSSTPKYSASFWMRIIFALVLLNSVAFLRYGASEGKPETANEKAAEPTGEVSGSLLFEKANQLVKDKDYQKAIPILEQLIIANPNDYILKAFLARVYIANGNALQGEGKLDQSLDMIMKSKQLIEELKMEKGSTIKDEEFYKNEEREISNLKSYLAGEKSGAGEQAIRDEKARVLLEKAGQSYKEKQYRLAKDLSTEAIQYQPKNALAYELLGDSEYFSQNLKAAKESYEKAFLIDSSKRVKDKLERVSKEIAFESKFAEYVDEHFLIRYKRSERFEGSEIREALRDSYREISRDFGHYLDYKTVVILYSHGEYEAIANMPHWSGALYDGKIRIPIHDPRVDSKNLRKFIQHELTHVFIIDMSDNTCPTWLHEGLAQYEENKIIPIDLSIFKKAAKTKSFLSWDDLKLGIDSSKDQASAIVFYHQSFSMTKYLVEKYRFVKIKSLLKELGRKTPFDDAFKKTIGVTPNEFYSQWQKAVLAEISPK